MSPTCIPRRAGFHVGDIQNEMIETVYREAHGFRRRSKVLLLRRIWREQDTLRKNEAAVTALFAGSDHAIGFARPLIESETFDRSKRHLAPFRRIDLDLHFALNGWNRIPFAHHFPARCRSLD